MSLRRVLVWGVLRGEHVGGRRGAAAVSCRTLRARAAPRRPRPSKRASWQCVAVCRVGQITVVGSLLWSRLPFKNKKTHKSRPSSPDRILDAFWRHLSRRFGRLQDGTRMCVGKNKAINLACISARAHSYPTRVAPKLVKTSLQAAVQATQITARVAKI